MKYYPNILELERLTPLIGDLGENCEKNVSNHRTWFSSNREMSLDDVKLESFVFGYEISTMIKTLALSKKY